MRNSTRTAKNMIKFNYDLIPKILDGSKKSTLRLGQKNYMLGDIHFYSIDYTPFGIHNITKVEKVLFTELRDRPDIVENEGYEKFHDLQAVLINIYGDKIFPDSYLTYIEFN